MHVDLYCSCSCAGVLGPTNKECVLRLIKWTWVNTFIRRWCVSGCCQTAGWQRKQWLQVSPLRWHMMMINTFSWYRSTDGNIKMVFILALFYVYLWTFPLNSPTTNWTLKLFSGLQPPVLCLSSPLCLCVARDSRGCGCRLNVSNKPLVSASHWNHSH